MKLIEKIKPFASSTGSGLIGGSVRLIVGQFGVNYQAIHYPSYDTMQRNFKEGDEIPIVRIKGNMVSIVPFCHEIWIDPENGFKGISYTVKTINT